MVIDSLKRKLRQIARFSSNMISAEMSSGHLLNVVCFFFFFLIAQHEEKPLYHTHVVTSGLYCSGLKLLLNQPQRNNLV